MKTHSPARQRPNFNSLNIREPQNTSIDCHARDACNPIWRRCMQLPKTCRSRIHSSKASPSTRKQGRTAGAFAKARSARQLRATGQIGEASAGRRSDVCAAEVARAVARHDCGEAGEWTESNLRNHPERIEHAMSAVFRNGSRCRQRMRRAARRRLRALAACKESRRQRAMSLTSAPLGSRGISHNPRRFRQKTRSFRNLWSTWRSWTARIFALREDQLFLFLAVLIGVFSGLASRLFPHCDRVGTPAVSRFVDISAARSRCCCSRLRRPCRRSARDSCFSRIARKRREPDQIRDVHLKRLHSIQHRHRKIHGLCPRHRHGPIARPRRPISPDRRRNRLPPSAVASSSRRKKCA